MPNCFKLRLPLSSQSQSALSPSRPTCLLCTSRTPPSKYMSGIWHTNLSFLHFNLVLQSISQHAQEAGVAVCTVVAATVEARAILIPHNLKLVTMGGKMTNSCSPAAPPLQEEQLVGDMCCTFLLFPLSSNLCRMVFLPPPRSFGQGLVRTVTVRMAPFFYFIIKRPFPQWQHKKHAG